MRAFLVKFAEQQGLNPLLAETWYNVPRAIFNHFSVYHYLFLFHFPKYCLQKVLLKFKGYFNTLQNLFPEIKFDHSAFSRGLSLLLIFLF